MLSLIKDTWSWVTGQALNQVLILLILSVVLFGFLLKYPVEFERTSYKVRQNIQVTETTKYIVNSTISEKGAKLKLCTQTYYVEVNNKEVPQ